MQLPDIMLLEISFLDFNFLALKDTLILAILNNWNFIYGVNITDTVREVIFAQYLHINPLPPLLRWENSGWVYICKSCAAEITFHVWFVIFIEILSKFAIESLINWW